MIPGEVFFDIRGGKKPESCSNINELRFRNIYNIFNITMSKAGYCNSALDTPVA